VKTPGLYSHPASKRQLSWRFSVRFVIPACRAHFAPDDMMNIYYYWSRGPLQLIKALLLFPSTYFRPMGGLFYSSLYALFGLNPLPYHVAISGLILANSYLAHRFASLISDSRLVGAITALLATYHSYLAAMIYWPSFIYDVLCFTFFFLALNCYISIRQKNEQLTKRQIVIVTIIYICALESKEMAVSLPVVLLHYELLWHAPSRRSWNDIRDWLLKDGLPSLISGAITLVYLIGKTSGSGALIRNEAFRPLFTWQRFTESNVLYLDTFLYRSPGHGFTAFTLLLTWAALIYMAWCRREKHFWLMVSFVIVTPLPIAFIPPRAAGCLYIPLVGWAIILTSLYLSLAVALRKVPLVRCLSMHKLRIALALIAIPCLWNINRHADRRSLPAIYAREELTWSFLQQLRTSPWVVKPNSEIVFINDPFSDSLYARWNAKFITELYYRDHTIRVLPARIVPLSAHRIAAADLVLTWKDGQLMQWIPAEH
jgi:hypothetical protein